jgi:aminoglycoside phosphotransferase (APT) family kinase protein
MRWLAGGKSHANHAVDVVDGRGYSHRLVLRRWVRPNWSVSDSDFDARREAKILELLSDSVVPAPKLVAVDAEGATCDVPALLMSRLPGRRPEPPEDMRAFLSYLATALLAIHSVDGWARTVVPVFRPWNEPRTLRSPAWSGRPEVWERAIEEIGKPPPTTPTCFIHRDYHPGNTLWSRGRLVGVVDWTSGSWGPACIDLPTCDGTSSRTTGWTRQTNFWRSIVVGPRTHLSIIHTGTFSACSIYCPTWSPTACLPSLLLDDSSNM